MSASWSSSLSSALWLCGLFPWLLFSLLLFLSPTVIVVVDGYLEDTYTSSDRDYLLNVITAAQDAQTGLFEKSLTTTFYATQILSELNLHIANEDILCSTLQQSSSTAVMSSSNWEEQHQILVSRSNLKQCLQRGVSAETMNKLKSGLKSKKLSSVIYSLHIIYALFQNGMYGHSHDTNELNSSANRIAILKHILQFQSKKDSLFAETQSGRAKSSVYRSAMALIAASQILSLPDWSDSELQSKELASLISSFMKCAIKLGKNYEKYTNQQLIMYSNSLTATALVIESINEFLLSLKQKEAQVTNSKSKKNYSTIISKFQLFSDAVFVEGVTRYVLKFRLTTSPTSARHVLTLLNIFEHSMLFALSRPVSISIAHKIFYDSVALQKSKRIRNELPLTIHISDVFGNRVLSEAARVALTTATDHLSQKDGPVGRFVQQHTDMDSESNTVYEFAFGDEIRQMSFDEGAFGVYNLVIQVTDPGHTGNTAAQDNNGSHVAFDLALHTTVKVLTAVRKLQFGAGYAKKSASMTRIEYPQTFVDDDDDGGREPFEIGPSTKMKFEVHVRSLKTPSYIVMQFVAHESGEIAIQFVPKKRQDKFAITVDVNKKPFKHLAEGRYWVNLMVSDPMHVPSSFVWERVLSLTCIVEEDEAKKDYEPVNDEVPHYAPQQPIAHTFHRAQAQPNLTIVYVFVVVVLLPFVLYLYVMLLRQGIGFRFAGVYDLLFVMSLLMIATVLFLYWWQWNIFQAGGYLTLACMPASVFGYKLLKQHLNHRVGVGSTRK